MRAFLALLIMSGASCAAAQETRDVGLPPPFDNPALPSPVNPALPPPTGQRYLPGVTGPNVDPDRRPVVRPLPFSSPQEVRGEVRESERRERSAPIERIRDIAPYLRSCWRPPIVDRRPLDATVQFSLRRSGELLGEPRLTYMNPRASSEQRAAIVDSVKLALTACAPLPLTSALGESLAGRPIRFRFILDRSDLTR